MFVDQQNLQDANAQIIHEPEQALLDLNNRKMTRKRVEHKMYILNFNDK